MSEKDKKSKQTPEENAAAEQPVNETPEAAAEAAPETYTVTKEQMQQMEELAKTLADANDKYLRLAAEYDNYRKRTAREKEHLYGDAKIDTIKPFLAVLDNLERGVSQFEEGDGHRQGMELICKQFSEVLTKLGVTEIPALGEKFDPEKHNAVMHTEDDTAEENTVVEVFQKLTRKVVSTRALNYLSAAGMLLFLGFFLVMANQDIQRYVFGNWG